MKKKRVSADDQDEAVSKIVAAKGAARQAISDAIVGSVSAFIHDCCHDFFVGPDSNDMGSMDLRFFVMANMGEDADGNSWDIESNHISLIGALENDYEGEGGKPTTPRQKLLKAMIDAYYANGGV